MEIVLLRREEEAPPSLPKGEELFVEYFILSVEWFF